MKGANREVVQSKFGRSFSLKHYSSANTNSKADFWHFHPELELVFVQGGNGVRHVGNHLSYYKDGDLVLIGSNVPHNGFTDQSTGNTGEVVIQFTSDFLGEKALALPEMISIYNLFDRALNGLAFHGETKRIIGARLMEFEKLSDFQALMELIQILEALSVSSDHQVLNASQFTMQYNKQDNDRAASIFQYVREHYKSKIELQVMADYSTMTIPSFCRYFKKLTGKTFTNFVNEYRIIKACKLLGKQSLSITEICYEVGFNNFAHFSKHFKAVTGNSPSGYRKELKETIRL